MALLNLTAVASCGFALPLAAYATNQKRGWSMHLRVSMECALRIYYLTRENVELRITYISRKKLLLEYLYAFTLFWDGHFCYLFGNSTT